LKGSARDRFQSFLAELQGKAGNRPKKKILDSGKGRQSTCSPALVAATISAKIGKEKSKGNTSFMMEPIGRLAEKAEQSFGEDPCEPTLAGPRGTTTELTEIRPRFN